jgi:hypothetical protein
MHPKYKNPARAHSSETTPGVSAATSAVERDGPLSERDTSSDRLRDSRIGSTGDGVGVEW